MKLEPHFSYQRILRKVEITGSFQQLLPFRRLLGIVLQNVPEDQRGWLYKLVKDSAVATMTLYIGFSSGLSCT
jgi:hypothetical protein